MLALVTTLSSFTANRSLANTKRLFFKIAKEKKSEQAAEDDEEDDPLDAFMADISEKAKTAKAEPKVMIYFLLITRLTLLSFRIIYRSVEMILRTKTNLRAMYAT